MAQGEKHQDHPLGLCLLCGLPAAGKTTMARALSHLLRKHQGWQCVHLAYDDLIPVEAFGQIEESLEAEGQQPLISRWRLHRQELLLYLEHFLQALITGCHYSPPPIRTEATWKSFVRSLEKQGLISTGKKDSAACQYLINSPSLTPTYFILDDNFYYRSMRYEVYQLARQYAVGFCQLFLDCQVEVCLQRNSQRKLPLPEEMICAMVQKIQRPNSEKYKWEQNSLILKSAGCPLADNFQVLDLLVTALKNPVQSQEENIDAKRLEDLYKLMLFHCPAELRANALHTQIVSLLQQAMDRAICAASALHQADQAIRRIVSHIMQNAKSHNLTSLEMKSFAAELNNLKVAFLEDLRHKSNEKNQCCLQNNVFNVNVALLFSQQADDVVKKYLNK